MTTLLPYFDLFFDKSFYSFNRPVLDMKPYSIAQTDDETILTHNILGIDEEDLKLETIKEGSNYYLLITGETEPEIQGQRKFTVRSKFSIDPDFIRKITYKVKNGILYVHLHRKIEKQTKLEITKE